MATTERIISPAVFTRETDVSYLQQGIGNIGAMIIGPTEKGQAFIPTELTQGYPEYVLKFGNSTGDFYTSYTAQEYLRNASGCYITRILGIDGYLHNNIVNLEKRQQHLFVPYLTVATN